MENSKMFMGIGVAMDDVRNGKMVRRASWPEEQKFIFMQVPAEISSETVPKMQSLPQSVKDYFQKTFNSPEEQIDAIYYSDQIALVGHSNSISSYSPTVADILASDWVLVEY